jgi:VCBS repeat-containing protein
MPGNEAPVAVDDGPYTVLSGGTVGGNVLANDTDADGDSLTALKVGDVAHGELTLSTDGTISYTADTGFHGSDTFTYQAHDGTDVSNVATVAIAVSPVASNVGLVDPSRGLWHLRSHESAEATTILSFYFGNPGDVPFTGDWDCDGNETPGLFRTSDAFAYLRNSNSQGIADTRFFFGNPSDIPLAGDFNGDGCDTLSIYRPSEARFYIMNKLGENEGGLGAADYSFLFGNQGDKPVVGDWDGDGIDEIGLHRESTGFFYYRNTLTTGIADGQFFFGDPGDRFVAGDWGVVDGTDTPAMFRPSNDTFYFRHTLTQGNADSQFVWTDAGSSWVPVAGEFTAD